MLYSILTPGSTVAVTVTVQAEADLPTNTVDQLNGGANVSIPIETPKGLGGMSPNLSLSYSSITLDDLFREAGSSEIEAQAGSPGIGWSLGGVSYIARTDTKYDDNVPAIDKKFSLVLNGTRVSISHQDGRWRTNPEIFAKLEWSGAASGSNTYKAYDFSGWTLWTGDGTKYEFGDAGPSPWPIPASAPPPPPWNAPTVAAPSA